MRFIRPILAAVALATAVSAAPAAFAQRGGSQSASVIVVDFQRLIANSDVGRDMSTKLQQIGQQMQGELQPEAQAIQTEQQSLQSATQNMTPEQVRANRALSQRVEALNTRYEAFRTRQQGLARDMEYTQQMTLTDFNNQITPIVREVMEARGAGVVIDANATQLVLPTFNATDDIVARLNQRLRTINVTRQSAPAQQQGAAAPGVTAPH